MKKIISAILSLIMFCSATVYCSFAEENDTNVQLIPLMRLLSPVGINSKSMNLS